jgi:uncharacterized membrane protein
MTETRYLKILWCYVVLNLAATISIFFPTYSENLVAAYESEPETWLMSNLWIAVFVLGAFVVVWLTGLVGLFFFKRWARPLSLCSTIAGFVIFPFVGASPYSGLEASLFEASSMVWGGILALSYFSPVSCRFER